MRLYFVCRTIILELQKLKVVVHIIDNYSYIVMCIVYHSVPCMFRLLLRKPENGLNMSLDNSDH